jgi:hypothetical protein
LPDELTSLLHPIVPAQIANPADRKTTAAIFRECLNI